MVSAIHRRSSLVVFMLSLLAAGCVPLQTAQRHERYPRRPPPRAERVVVDRAVRGQIARDATHYVRRLDRALRLNRRQERRIKQLLADRAYDRVRRTRARNWERAYPFPRTERSATRAIRDWWKKTDRQILRVLNRRQRTYYRDLVRNRYDHRRNRPRGHHRGNG